MRRMIHATVIGDPIAQSKSPLIHRFWLERLGLAGDYRRDREQFVNRGAYQRFAVTFAGGGGVRLLDPRRLSRVRLNPDIEALGPDALGLSPAAFRAVLTAGRRVSTVPVKTRLMDQSVLAGVGNLLADEALWRARIHPRSTGWVGRCSGRWPRPSTSAACTPAP